MLPQLSQPHSFFFLIVFPSLLEHDLGTGHPETDEILMLMDKTCHPKPEHYWREDIDVTGDNRSFCDQCLIGKWCNSQLLKEQVRHHWTLGPTERLDALANQELTRAYMHMTKQAFMHNWWLCILPFPHFKRQFGVPSLCSSHWPGACRVQEKRLLPIWHNMELQKPDYRGSLCSEPLPAESWSSALALRPFNVELAQAG